MVTAYEFNVCLCAKTQQLDRGMRQGLRCCSLPPHPCSPFSGDPNQPPSSTLPQETAVPVEEIQSTASGQKAVRLSQRPHAVGGRGRGEARGPGLEHPGQRNRLGNRRKKQRALQRDRHTAVTQSSGPQEGLHSHLPPLHASCPL